MNKGFLGGGFRPSPFTLILNIYFLLSVFFCGNRFRWDMKTGLFFVFGTFVLFAVSLFLTPKRNLKNPWLSGILILSLASVFLNSFRYSQLTQRFINFSLMCEGFIFVLAGVMLYKIIYENGETQLRYYVGLWVAIAVWLFKAIVMKSVSPILAILLTGLVYNYIHKEHVKVSLIFLLGVVLVFFNWNYILLKWECRPIGWIYTIKEIIARPTGYGFDNSVMQNLIKTSFGWQFRHNDFLNLARDIGLPVLILVFGYFRELFYLNKDVLLFACLATVILMCGQTTIYLTRNAILIVPLFALLEARQNA